MFSLLKATESCSNILTQMSEKHQAPVRNTTPCDAHVAVVAVGVGVSAVFALYILSNCLMEVIIAWSLNESVRILSAVTWLRPWLSTCRANAASLMRDIWKKKKSFCGSVGRAPLANQTSPHLTHHSSNLMVKYIHIENKVGEIYWPSCALDSLSIIIIIKASVQQLFQLWHVNESAQ